MADPEHPTRGPAVLDPPAALTTGPTMSRRQLGAALLAGAVSAVAVPAAPPGIGVGVVGLSIAVAVLRGRPAVEQRDTWCVSFGVAALAASLVPAVSDAAWVVALALVAGAGMAALAVGGGGTWRAFTRISFATVPASFRGTVGLARGAAESAPTGPRFSSTVRTVLLTLALLLVFGALFVSADRVFGSIVDRYLRPEVDLGVATWHLAVALVVAVGVAALLLLPSERGGDPPPGPPARYLRGSEWQVPLVGLVLLFAAFVAVQFRVLFGGHERVLETVGLTYATYAHQGFGQLVVVAILTLAVIVAANRYAIPRGPVQRRVRQALLAALCLLTLVVLMSARHRLNVYEEAFGSTRLRLSAQTIILWLAAVFVLVMAAGATRRTSLLPRAVVLLTGVAVVAYGFAQPDAIIARANVDRFEATQRIDLDHLAGLSADAVPALLDLPEAVRDCAVERQVARLDAASGHWGALNLSRWRAAGLVDDRIGACAAEMLVDARATSGGIGR